jgi:transposase
MSREFDGLYARVCRPSIPPERLLRAQLLQTFYWIRSERVSMEHVDYTLLFAGSSGWTWTSRSGRRRSSPRIATGF